MADIVFPFVEEFGAQGDWTPKNGIWCRLRSTDYRDVGVYASVETAAAI